MRRARASAVLGLTLLMSGCMRPYTPPEAPMPPNTILLSQMMREVSAHPGFTEQLIQQISVADGKRGPTLLTPELVNELRTLILGKNWQGLDRFPGWTMVAVTPTVRVVDTVIEKEEKGAAASSVQRFLDLGPYALDREQAVSLDQPSRLPPFTTSGLVTELGDDVQRGDGPNELAPEHAESQRLADALNRLAGNALEGAKPFHVELAGQTATTPQGLIAALAATGHQVSVIDARYFANFGHLHYKGEDVMMPFWVNTGFAVPGTGGPFGIGARPLLVPVAHAELEWRVHGPKINAEVSYYFGIDGKSEWRTMDTLDQAWVLKRAAHTYTGTQAIGVTRLAGLLTIGYMHQHERRPELPFGGYYTLGVCQDGVAAIEKQMTGATTLFPNTAKTALFDDSRDAEVNALIAAVPKDRDGALPQPERIFGSLPAAPGPANEFGAVTIPGLADDLRASYAAWQRGELHRKRSASWVVAAVAFAGASALIVLGWKRRRR
jgi:hypothetical protein